MLNLFNDREIAALVAATKGLEKSSDVSSEYKEIQIHGPIEFSKDIERLYVCKSELVNPKILEHIEQFSKRIKVDYEIFKPERALLRPVPPPPALIAPLPTIHPSPVIPKKRAKVSKGVRK